jgi:hypothetical protein
MVDFLRISPAMMRHVASATALIASVSLLACAQLGLGAKASSKKHAVSPEARRAAIRHAQVWAPTDVPAMNLKAGPQGPGAFAPNQRVTCDYLDKKMSGQSPKFACVIPPEDELKVKYGQDNGEVFAEVAASRLFWALGFYAERMYPVRVVCRGCPSNIKDTEFASIQRKIPGRDLEGAEVVGWAWPELDLVDSAAGASPAQRDALKLLAVFIQHTDSKPEQQRLICVDKHPKRSDGEPCADTIMMVHDLGQTFGSANLFNRDAVGSVNLSEWSHMSIWKDPKRCVANLPPSQTGTLDNPAITEAGRKFLADLLAQLTDAQLHDLFDVARFPERMMPNHSSEGTTVDAWVAAFDRKRDEIVNHTCPN